jgi:hypothetical protein
MYLQALLLYSCSITAAQDSTMPQLQENPQPLRAVHSML